MLTPKEADFFAKAKADGFSDDEIASEIKKRRQVSVSATARPRRGDELSQSDPSPAPMITKDVKPAVDLHGETARVQDEIRRGKPGEPLAAAEARAGATNEANNPFANDWIAQQVVENAVAGPVLGKIAKGAVTRSAAREPGAVKEAVKSLGIPTTIGQTVNMAKGVVTIADETAALAGRALGVAPRGESVPVAKPVTTEVPNLRWPEIVPPKQLGSAPIEAGPIGSPSSRPYIDVEAVPNPPLPPGPPRPKQLGPRTFEMGPIEDTGGVPSAVDVETTVRIPNKPMRDIAPKAKGEGVDIAAGKAARDALPDDTAMLDKTQRIAVPSKAEKAVARGEESSSLEGLLKQSLQTPKEDWAAGRVANAKDTDRILAKIAGASVDGSQNVHSLIEQASQLGVPTETIDAVIANAIKFKAK